LVLTLGRMSDKYVADNTYSDEELLALWRECYARISVSGQTYQMNIGGGTRMFTSANLSEVWRQIELLERRINVAGSLPTVNYARFSRR